MVRQAPQYSSGIEHHVVESKRGALHAVGRGGLRTRWSYRRVDMTHLAVLSCSPPRLGGMHLLPPTLLRSMCTASQLRAGLDSVSARLTKVEGTQASCTSHTFFLFGSTRTINFELAFWHQFGRVALLVPFVRHATPIYFYFCQYLFFFIGTLTYLNLGSLYNIRAYYSRRKKGRRVL